MIRALSPRRFTELAFAIVAIVALVPFDPVLATTGLDPSWQQALHHAIERGLQFGTDIVFTYGPLGFAHTRVYWPGLFAVTLLYWLAFAVALAHAAIALTRTAGARPWIEWPALFGAVLIAGLYAPDAVPFSLAVLVVWYVHAARPSATAFCALCALLGVAGLAKLTNGMAGAIALAGGGVILVMQRRPQVAASGAAAFAAAIVLGWLALGQHAASLPAFVSHTIEIVTGYPEAMALPAPPAEKVLFVALALLALARPAWRAVATRDFALLAACAATALLLVLAFRQGFTRYDRFHAVTAFASLAIAAAVTALHAMRPDARLDRAIAGTIVVAAFAALVNALDDHFYNSPPLVAIRVVESAAAGVRGAWELATGSGRLASRHEAALAAIRADVPLPALSGTIDTYSHDQAAVLAHGLRWNPRPVLQSYSSYTPRLAALDVAHVTGPRAPDHLLFAVQAIDGKLPALDDGASWLPILERYDLRTKGERLLLDRAAQPRPASTRPLGTWRGSGWIDLPDADGLRLAAFRVGAREGAGLFDKRVGVSIELRLGAERRPAAYRFVPGAAQLPFLFSPLVAATQDFARLFDRCATYDAANNVRGVRILDAAGRELPFEIDLYAVAFTPPPTGAAPGCSPR